MPARTPAAPRQAPKPKPPTRRGGRTVREITERGATAAALIELFLSEHVRHTAGPLAGRPFLLEPWQRENIVRPVFGTLQRNGTRRYREAVVGLPRWQGKSQSVAGLGLACMFTEPTHEGEYYVVASNMIQAGIVFNKAKRIIMQDPLLRRIAKVYRKVIEVPETGAIFRTMPWDADSAQGWHPQVAIIDEYHVHRDASMREALLSGMVGTKNGLLLTITTAGKERKGPLWQLLVDLMGKPGPYRGQAKGDPRAWLYWVGAGDDEDGTDPKVWRHANPATWIKQTALRDQFNTLPFATFERYHLNRFPSTGTNRAYSGKLWHACRERPRIDPDLPAVIGLDASWTRDTTALVFDQVDGEGVHNPLAWVWRKNEALGYIEHEAVEAKIVELCEDFNVTRIACDPNYFTRSMLRLQNEFGLPIEEFRQNHVKMSAASMMLLDVLKEGRMRHGGAAELTDQVLNAGAQETPYGWRVTKVQDDLKIDACVALVMAAYLAEAEALTARDPRVISARG